MIYLIYVISNLLTPKYFISCWDDDLEIKPLHIMLQKKSAYIKRYAEETKWMYFSIEDHKFLKNAIIFGIKLAMAWKQNFIVKLSTKKNSKNQNKI